MFKRIKRFFIKRKVSFEASKSFNQPNPPIESIQLISYKSILEPSSEKWRQNPFEILPSSKIWSHIFTRINCTYDRLRFMKVNTQLKGLCEDTLNDWLFPRMVPMILKSLCKVGEPSPTPISEETLQIILSLRTVSKECCRVVDEFLNSAEGANVMGMERCRFNNSRIVRFLEQMEGHHNIGRSPLINKAATLFIPDYIPLGNEVARRNAEANYWELDQNRINFLQRIGAHLKKLTVKIDERSTVYLRNLNSCHEILAMVPALESLEISLMIEDEFEDQPSRQQLIQEFRNRLPPELPFLKEMIVIINDNLRLDSLKLPVYYSQLVKLQLHNFTDAFTEVYAGETPEKYTFPVLQELHVKEVCDRVWQFQNTFKRKLLDFIRVFRAPLLKVFKIHILPTERNFRLISIKEMLPFETQVVSEMDKVFQNINWDSRVNYVNVNGYDTAVITVSREMV